MNPAFSQRVAPPHELSSASATDTQHGDSRTPGGDRGPQRQGSRLGGVRRQGHLTSAFCSPIFPRRISAAATLYPRSYDDIADSYAARDLHSAYSPNGTAIHASTDLYAGTDLHAPAGDQHAASNFDNTALADANTYRNSDVRSTAHVNFYTYGPTRNDALAAHRLRQFADALSDEYAIPDPYPAAR